jgi:molecular chaperone HscB|tara:strand:+ start:274 stop:798 length:525 start_codon:yes stop_codon:yes gene_type:complete
VDFKQDYFEIFQLPRTFDLDLGELGERFRLLQKSVHPDKFSSATSKEKMLSMQWATQINAAYTTLKSALPRAVYLLGLEGTDLSDNPILDPVFLMEQIDLREQLEEIEQLEGPVSTLDEFKVEVKSVVQSLERDFASSYSGGDQAKAEQAVYKLQFMNKLLLAANTVEEKLLDY